MITTLDELATKVELHIDEYRDLLAVFIQATRADLDALRQALASREAEAAAGAAHNIKGAALNLELSEMAGTAARAEAQCRAGQTDSLNESIALLAAFLDDLVGLVRS